MNYDTDKPIDIKDPFARRLILQYVDRRKADTNSLRSALALGHFASIQVTGHNLSGSGSAYGLRRVSELGASLECAAKARNTKEVSRLIDELDKFVTGLRLS